MEHPDPLHKDNALLREECERLATLVMNAQREQQRLSASHAELRRVLESRSWRWTAPLRIIGRAFRAGGLSVRHPRA